MFSSILPPSARPSPEPLSEAALFRALSSSIPSTALASPSTLHRTQSPEGISATTRAARRTSRG
jgi:hypothetical protein